MGTMDEAIIKYENGNLEIIKKLTEYTQKLKGSIVIHKVTNNPIATGSCADCKHEKFLNELDGSYCKTHKHSLNDMFDEKFTLDKIGCRQFVNKVD